MAYSKKVRTAFLAAYRRLGTIEGAAKDVGVSREVHYDWKRRHADYLEAFEAAAEPVADLYVDEVVNRAIHGWIEPVFSNGKRALDYEMGPDGKLVMENGKPKAVPASILRKSDACLLALCAARVPGFSQKSGSGGRTGTGIAEDDNVEVTVIYKEKPIPLDDDDGD